MVAGVFECHTWYANVWEEKVSILFCFYKRFFFNIYVYGFPVCMHVYPWRTEEGIESPGAGVAEDC